MHLRAARADDAEALAGLCEWVFLDTYCSDGLRADLTAEARAAGDARTLAAQACDPGWRCLLLAHTVNGAEHLTGYAAVRVAHPDAELVRLYLVPRFQGQGLGSRLLAAAEGAAREAGASRLALDCWEGNLRARGFYAARGYTDAGPRVYTFGGRAYSNRHLVKPL